MPVNETEMGDPKAGSAELLAAVTHRPWPLPPGRPAIRMRWTELLFAHWPVSARELRPLLPRGLELDTFDGTGWAGVVPFRMERVALLGLPPLPGTSAFPEVNLRTYVVEPKSGHAGVYFFSLDAANPLAVVAARLWYGLPYFLARMKSTRKPDGGIRYESRRLFARGPANVAAEYRSSGPGSSIPGDIERFLTERYALFTGAGDRIMRADVHHRRWPLEAAQAHFQDLSLAAAHGVQLPATAPLLHYSRTLEVLAWRPRRVS